MNEVVKYHNDMNRVALRKFNVSELNIFLAICTKMKDKGLTEIKFEFDYLKNLINYTSTDLKDFIKDLDNTYQKLVETSIRIGGERKWVRFVLFTKYEVDLDNKTIAIKVNEEFKWVLNELTSNFTRFELSEFISIKSSYAKELYRRLKQLRTTGFYTVDLNEFKRILDIPNSYQISDIDKRVLKPCIDELKPYFKGLKIQKIKGKYNKVERLIFTFKVDKIDTSSYIEKEKLNYKYNSKKQEIKMDYTDEEIEFNFDEIKIKKSD